MNPKRILSALIMALFVLAGGSAFAGEKYKCTATTQECLDMMVAHYKKTGWLGLKYEWVESERQLEVTEVFADSPASKAGFKIGDRVTALNGVSFTEENEEKLAAIQKTKKPGVQFTFTVLRRGKERSMPVTLGEMPTDVIARAVGNHLLEHVTPEPAKTAKKKDR